MTGTYQVPDHFCVPPFYEAGDAIDVDTTELRDIREMLERAPFYYDMIETLGLAKNQLPERGEIREEIYMHWERHKSEIVTLFDEKAYKEASLPVIIGAGWLLTMFFWGQGARVTDLRDLKTELGKLEALPPNFKGRIEYILENPNMHVAYIQLNELFDECRKKLVRLELTRKK